MPTRRDRRMAEGARVWLGRALRRARGLCPVVVLTGLVWAEPLAGQERATESEATVSRVQAPQPGDVIRLQVWREPDLSGEFPVDSDGFVVFPRIGVVEVTRLTPDALESLLVSTYSAHLNHAAIDVEVLRRVQILGEVRNPGVYTLDPTMTVADALAVAGGRTAVGHPHRLDLIRRGERVKVDLSPASRIGDLPIRSGDHLYVPERSWWSRHSAIVSSAITASASLLIALIL